MNTEEVEILMKDTSISEEVRSKLELIQEVRDYLEDSLSLAQTENYTTYYDQKDRPILWVVKASPEFKIEAYQWEFPFLGMFPYKGFFDLEAAEEEERKMQALGFDTAIDEVNAWSTLGWLKDPILSSMLKRTPARLAELIIHESTHATLYVKDSAEFNENLATFIGIKGAEQFIRQKFGKDAEELKSYQLSRERGKIYKKYMVESIEELNGKYAAMDESLSLEDKRDLKQQWFDELKFGLLETEYFTDKVEGKKRLEKFNINNATLSGFSTYSSMLSEIDALYKEKYDGDLKKMIIDFKKKYRSL